VVVYVIISVADPHHFDVDPDPTFHFDPDPYPDPAYHFDPDPDPSFQIKLKVLKKITSNFVP
jgi:hypothetical protein